MRVVQFALLSELTGINISDFKFAAADAVLSSDAFGNTVLGEAVASIEVNGLDSIVYDDYFMDLRVGNATKEGAVELVNHVLSMTFTSKHCRNRRAIIQ